MQAPLETDLHTKGMPGMACNYLSVSESGEKNTNHFQTNPFRRPLGCNFASFPFSGVGLFFSLAFCHFPSPLGQTYVSWATSMQLLDMVSWPFFFFFVFKILTHKMQRFIDGGHCMLTWGLLNGTQNDRWMMYTRVCTSYAAHRRSYPGWAKIMAGRAVVCQVLVVSDMTFIKFNINHYSIIHWYSRFLVSSALGRPAWSGSSGCVETTSNVRTATALHVLQDSFGTSSLSILSDFKYQSVSVNHSVCRRFVRRIFGVETDVEEGGARVMGSASPAARCAVIFFQIILTPTRIWPPGNCFFPPFRSFFYDQSQWNARSQLCLIALGTWGCSRSISWCLCRWGLA